MSWGSTNEWLEGRSDQSRCNSYFCMSIIAIINNDNNSNHNNNPAVSNAKNPVFSLISEILAQTLPSTSAFPGL